MYADHRRTTAATEWCCDINTVNLHTHKKIPSYVDNNWANLFLRLVGTKCDDKASHYKQPFAVSRASLPGSYTTGRSRINSSARSLQLVNGSQILNGWHRSADNKLSLHRSPRHCLCVLETARARAKLLSEALFNPLGVRSYRESRADECSSVDGLVRIFPPVAPS